MPESLLYVMDLGAQFEALDPGASLVYFSGDSLALEARDWDKRAKGEAIHLREVRDWAARLAGSGNGFLTQKRVGERMFDYRITKAKEH